MNYSSNDQVTTLYALLQVISHKILSPNTDFHIMMSSTFNSLIQQALALGQNSKNMLNVNVIEKIIFEKFPLDVIFCETART